MASSSPPFQTPRKRKRGQETPLTPIPFTFSISKEDTAEDGSSSPRTTVAHRFKGLDLQSGSGGGVGDLAGSRGAADDAADELPAKRQKPDEPMSDVSDATILAPVEPPGPKTVAVVQLPGSVGGQDSSPTRESAPASRRRAGTPPLRLNKSARLEADANGGGSDDDDDDGEPHIVDPVRAALTWHDDEITVYDPDDKDDDGTGVNGIGFRPSPAIAHARSLRRRQQINEYRRREESEARTRRSQRRREGASPSGISKTSPRKVRFSDSEIQNIAVTI
ncbi:hypothetical protein ISF_07657 [Cordyceps fumosorosea ARSEF 2679]|uniref:Uncharacterized protein n=1 Tax=Cordyceps fumosorosea (strain ARSEF 2679) TaxID=1081104 RepID=A0A167NXM8_CORFA|nr:hypothetical protein ISF_07657 [Cordyceps fumosorosea ARSEF 2679]OAA56059.1 hypothetical protein ISF_07657 [Cordyceps fumosorosea ARSEF 2679]